MRLSARAEIIFETKKDTRSRLEAEPISTFEMNSREAAIGFGNKLAMISNVYEAIGTEPTMTIASPTWTC
jgi:hypothetical protein